MEIWHNPRCSKSRDAMALLHDAGVDATERRYLDDAPTADELRRVLDALGKPPWDIARLGEPIARELGMEDWPREAERWIEAMVNHPILIERPIVITADGRAVLGRPPEAIRQLLAGA